MKKITLKMFALVMAVFMSQGIMAQNEVLFEETFDKTLGAFTVEGEGPTEGIWKYDLGYARGDAYGKIDGECTTFFVSPEITLSTSGNVANYAYYFINYGQAAVTEQMGFCVREVGGEWEQLEIPVCIEEDNTISSGDIIIPSAYAGKKVQIGFKYYCESSGNAGVWCIDKVTVVKDENAVQKADPEIAFDMQEVEVVMGNELKLPNLINPNAVEVAYSSENPNVATVDAATGAVTLVGEGTTNIVATSVENDLFMSAKASYKLTVIPNSDPVVIFEETFEKDLGAFTVEGNDGATDGIWKYDMGYARGDAYGKIDGECTTYFVSPEIVMTTATNIVNYTYYFINYGQAAVTEQMGFCVREVGGEWEQLEIPVCIEEDNTISSGDIIIPSAYAGKKVQVAFKYYCESSGNAGVWCINDITVRSEVTTGIENVENKEINDNKIYDLQGRRLNKLHKGINIVNGKKVIVK